MKVLSFLILFAVWLSRGDLEIKDKLEVCNALFIMYKNHHPNAYIRGMRNTESGLSARTKILLSLEEGKSTVKDISGAIGISYASVLHHLHLLRMNRIVERTNLKVPYYWKATGVGHARLIEFKK